MIYGYPKVGDLIAGPSWEYMHEHFHTALVIERREEHGLKVDERGPVSVSYYRMLNSNGKFEWYSEDYVRNFCDFLNNSAGHKNKNVKRLSHRDNTPTNA